MSRFDPRQSRLIVWISLADALAALGILAVKLLTTPTTGAHKLLIASIPVWVLFLVVLALVFAAMLTIRLGFVQGFARGTSETLATLQGLQGQEHQVAALSQPSRETEAPPEEIRTLAEENVVVLLPVSGLTFDEICNRLAVPSFDDVRRGLLRRALYRLIQIGRVAPDTFNSRYVLRREAVQAC